MKVLSLLKRLRLCFYVRELDITDIEIGLVVALRREDLLFAQTDGDRMLKISY